MVVGFLVEFRTHLHVVEWIVSTCLNVCCFFVLPDILSFLLLFLVTMFHNLANCLKNLYEKLKRVNPFPPNVLILSSSTENSYTYWFEAHLK